MPKKHKLGLKILMVTLGVALVLSISPGCFGSGRETVVLGETDWDSGAVQAHIAGFILENGYDYEAVYELGSTITLAAAIARGDIDVLIEAWTESAPEAYADGFASGAVVELGVNFADSWQGWLVPTYMITNGDLPADISVEDMPDYWELFKDPEDPSKGRFYNCIPGWACEETNAMKFDAYGLNDTYTLFPSGSNAALVASMAAAYEQEEPWFGYYWEPTWAMGKYDMTRIGEPAFTQEIWDTTRGSAYPADIVVTLATADFIDREPVLAEFFTDWEVTSAILNQAMAYMAENEASYDEAAIYFLQEYESVWTQWVSADIASKVKAALP